MATAGIIFSNIHDRNVSQLTRERTMASVPIGGRYRLVDFMLSNMVNAGITKIGIITKTNYQSLAKHIGTGKDWDLARKQGGLVILSPFSNPESGPLYNNRLEALQSARDYIYHSSEDVFILTDSDVVFNMPFDDIVDQHKASGADLTGAYKAIDLNAPLARTSTVFDIDSEGRVTNLAVAKGISGKVNLFLNVWVINRDLLITIIQDSLTYGKKSLTRDVLAPRVNELNIMTYEHKGYIGIVDSLNSYFEVNQEMLQDDVRQQLFLSENYPVYTKVKDSAPTKYGDSAKVTNSMISDGCIIDGIVENSILFRDVTVAKGAVVKNCILMQDCVIESNATIDHLITDKRVTIRGGRHLSGCEGHPFYISKNDTL